MSLVSPGLILKKHLHFLKYILKIRSRKEDIMPDLEALKDKIDELALRDWNLSAIKTRFNKLVDEGIPSKPLAPRNRHERRQLRAGFRRFNGLESLFFWPGPDGLSGYSDLFIRP